MDLYPTINEDVFIRKLFVCIQTGVSIVKSSSQKKQLEQKLEEVIILFSIPNIDNLTLIQQLKQLTTEMEHMASGQTGILCDIHVINSSLSRWERKRPRLGRYVPCKELIRKEN